jgi:hypothetical protein
VLHRRRRGGSRADIVAKEEMWLKRRCNDLLRRYGGSGGNLMALAQMLWLRKRRGGSEGDIAAPGKIWVGEVVAQEEM